MAPMHGYKRRLSNASLVNKYKTLREVEASQSCIAALRKCSVFKNMVSHWTEQKQKKVGHSGRKYCIEKRKQIKTTTYKKSHNAIYKYLLKRFIYSLLKVKISTISGRFQLLNFCESKSWCALWCITFSVEFLRLQKLILRVIGLTLDLVVLFSIISIHEQFCDSSLDKWNIHLVQYFSSVS